MNFVRVRPTVAEIDLSALKRNLHKLRTLTGDDKFFCPMIKANGYGHGAIALAKAMQIEGIEHLGVSLIEEAIELREAGIQSQILVFGTFRDLASARACKEFSLTPVISSSQQLNVLEQTFAKSELKFHLKFDTGMSRLGFAVSEATTLRTQLAKFSSWSLEGICTHLLKGDDAAVEQGFTSAQLAEFQKALSIFEGQELFAHALNSSGLISQSGKNIYGARPGIALYGGCDGFESLMTLKSQVVSVKEIKPGKSVSYNATWTAKRKSLIGVVPVGYADGLPRKLSNSFSVLCRGERVPAVGTVCMDYVMIDLTDLSSKLNGLGVGEEVVFFGRQGRAEIRALEWAQILGTISYEIFTGISSRVPREYVST